jgi:hypothetical protein
VGPALFVLDAICLDYILRPQKLGPEFRVYMLSITDQGFAGDEARRNAKLGSAAYHADIDCRSYSGLNALQIDLGSALERAAAPWISGPLEAAQAMHCEAHPMRSPQGQTAILEGKDDVATVPIAPANMRSEAHSELHMGSAQTGAMLDRALDHSHAR